MPALEIDLSDETISACEERIEGTEFDSVAEYVTFVVGEVVTGDEEELEGGEGAVDREQLEALGYL